MPNHSGPFSPDTGNCPFCGDLGRTIAHGDPACTHFERCNTCWGRAKCASCTLFGPPTAARRGRVEEMEDPTTADLARQERKEMYR